MVNKDSKPFHHRESQHWHLRRPRNLLKSQRKLSFDRYKSQSKMATPNTNQNLSY
jgi:hypothetical protein